MDNRNFRIVFVFLFCLSAVQFFRPVAISPSALFYAYCGVLSLAVTYIVGNYNLLRTDGFTTPLLVLLGSIMVSTVSASFFWGQTFVESLKAVLPFMSYSMYFLLVALNMRPADVEKVILIMGIAFMVIFFVAFLAYPMALVGGDTEKYSDDRGFVRISLVGAGFLFLFSFYSLSRYLRRLKFKWLAMYVVSVICIVMTLTRTYIAFSAIFSFLYIIRSQSVATKIVAGVVIAVTVYAIMQTNFARIMIEETKLETSDKENIRIQSAEYYLNKFSPNIYARILGNGQPYADTWYFNFIDEKEKTSGLYLSDIGYIGLYVKFGIFAIIAYIIMFYRTATSEVGKRYLYCKYFLFFIFSISIIIDAPFNISFIPAILMALYIVARRHLGMQQVSDGDIE